ncbi:MAG: putative rane protein [Firmicutes bacterium]|nr:putative rane protein [Bacillota bacterium]MBP2641336.1 putative rane protein [Bacillota bacterium]
MQGQIDKILQQQEGSFAKKGIGWGLLAGLGWGLDCTLMGMALGMAPLAGGISLFAAPLVGSCLHDGFAALWIFLKNFVDGRWRDYLRTLRTRPARFILIGSFLGGPIGMSCNLLAIYFAGASYTTAITAAYPAIGALLGAIFLKEKISRRVWVGIFTAILGSFVVGYVPPAGDQYPHFYLGIGLAAVAALGWAMEGVFSTYGMDLVDSDIAIGIRQLASFIVYFFVVLPIAGSVAYKILLESLTSPVFLFIAGIAMVGSISYTSWYRAMNMTGVGRAMGLNVTYALWSVLFGWLLVNLTITPNLLAGVILICIGTILTIGSPKDLVNLRSK